MAIIIILAILIVVAALSFLWAAVVTLTWNVVVPYFHGPAITFWVSYAGYWLIVFIGGALRAIKPKKED